MRGWAKFAVVFGALLMVLTGCSDDDGGEDAAGGDDEATTTTAPAETLDILVTNDDGIEGEGMALLVDALQDLPDTTVTVVVPDGERSGSGGSTTDGPLTAVEATTLNGDEALAVDGFPADSVIYGLEEVFTDEPPDLVVSGINTTQNIGPGVAVSGTVAAARQAAALGVPALAVSQGLAEELDFPAGAAEAVAWVEEHRDEVLADDTPPGEQAPAVNLNVPSCGAGEPREVVEVPIAEDAPGEQAIAAQDCASTLEDPADDVEGFTNGFVVLSDLPPGLSEVP